MLTWNGGNCCGYAQWNKVDDVGFTRALLDDLAKVVNVDAKRVFATGISNGGIMCYRLASELSDRIAAIAPVAGTMGTKTCNPKRPVSVMHFHGTDDKFLPFKGGIGTRAWLGLMFCLGGAIDPSLGEGGWLPGKARRHRHAEEGRRWHERPAEDLRAGQGRCRGGPLRHQRRRSHLAGARPQGAVSRQIDQEHFRQRPDVGVLQAASPAAAEITNEWQPHDQDRVAGPVATTCDVSTNRDTGPVDCVR